MEEKSRKQGRVEARFEGGQGPEGAVAPYMDGWMRVFEVKPICGTANKSGQSQVIRWLNA